MSVRAYRINDINKRPSFNLWHDEELLNFLEDNGATFFSSISGEIELISLDPAILQKALYNPKINIDIEARKKLEEDIKFSKRKYKDGDTLYYQCY